METNLNVQVLRVKSTVKTFGFSLSTPVDIDDNGFPDIAIGAYKSGHALVLKSRPVLKVNLFGHSSPRSLDRNTTRFQLTFCVEHFKNGKLFQPFVESFNLTILVDKNFKRVNETKIFVQHIFKWNDTLVTLCINKDIQLLVK